MYLKNTQTKSILFFISEMTLYTRKYTIIKINEGKKKAKKMFDR